MADAEAALGELQAQGQPFRPQLDAIAARIEEGTDAPGVARDCQALVDALAQAGGLQRSPRTAPDMAQAAQLYREGCAACHARDGCLLYTSPSPRDYAASRMPSSA